MILWFLVIGWQPHKKCCWNGINKIRIKCSFTRTSPIGISPNFSPISLVPLKCLIAGGRRVIIPGIIPKTETIATYRYWFTRPGAKLTCGFYVVNFAWRCSEFKVKSYKFQMKSFPFPKDLTNFGCCWLDHPGLSVRKFTFRPSQRIGKLVASNPAAVGWRSQHFPRWKVFYRSTHDSMHDPQIFRTSAIKTKTVQYHCSFYKNPTRHKLNSLVSRLPSI